MKTYRQTFDYLYHNRPSTQVAERINHRIDKIRTARAGRKAFVFGIFCLAALVALTVVARYAYSQVTSSGLYDYVSLFVSDSSYLFINWKSTILSIVESLPMSSVVLTLATLLVTIYTYKKSSGYIKQSHSYHTPLLRI